MKIGYGWDPHEFKRGVPLKIGGVEIAHPKGLGGHSDGDVLLHAITDALLGAIAAPKIGPHANAIRQRVSELSGVPADSIGIKAKTPEGMGTDNAAIAHAVVLLQRAPRNVRRRSQKKSSR